MADMFLGGIGYAQGFENRDGQLVKIFEARTLTDATVSFSVTAEEVRGGPGNPLLGQFFHNANMGITLVDTMFRLEYIQKLIGADILNGGIGLVSETLTVEAGPATAPAGTTKNNFVTLKKGSPSPLLEGQDGVIWFSKAGTDDFLSLSVPAGVTEVPIPGATVGDSYCVKYYDTFESAKRIMVRSNFMPSEIFLVITSNLYAGSANVVTTGKVAGTVTIKVPRFQPSGNFEMSVSAATAGTISLEGNALAYNNDCEGGLYAEISMMYASEYTGYDALYADQDYITVGDIPAIYAIGANKTPKLIANNDANITFAPALVNGVWAQSGAETITFKYWRDNSDGSQTEITLTKTQEISTVTP